MGRESNLISEVEAVTRVEQYWVRSNGGGSVLGGMRIGILVVINRMLHITTVAEAACKIIRFFLARTNSVTVSADSTPTKRNESIPDRQSWRTSSSPQLLNRMQLKAPPNSRSSVNAASWKHHLSST